MQLKAFKRKFGRDPRPGEPVFFDPDEDTPTEMTEERLNRDMLEMMEETGFPPEFIYAFKKTGLLISEENKDHVPKADLDAWEAAIDYFDEIERKREKNSHGKNGEPKGSETQHQVYKT